ncbi:S1C family serine protease [Thermoflexus sp.]|uniref:S1C family serine protease n=1 Tax=Thermoflexus sp. TaxID=1969742 RepID=UPI0025E68F70|nr:trypsin-like peptidase domain-containing protein [Thermoflexus sp.]MDW8179909.1 trypsin-like peptidase domain-containing protein [Anaerolineae bacterium]MCS6963272.1 trypsin-like peptidase domain-containing protein [Thermoflexus sp.]MCS7350458.1 trypsin-like peptidase domain-containing protein [Thermoflexus sp.]MCX7689351.1 trypsin-like peptidase domain-containing protein [Thermoflexus sp.]MDW8183975.1 trypsin-like peptidase domain-containing protein [Anaerolineae bacterium]
MNALRWIRRMGLGVLLLLAACQAVRTPPSSQPAATPPREGQSSAPVAGLATPIQVAAQEAGSPVEALEQHLEAIYQQVNPSVVHIRVRSGRGVFQQESTGSGFVYDSQGHIVTNYHVVEGASAIVVTFADGTESTAQVVGVDPDSDLAVIRVDAPTAPLRPIALGDSGSVRPGQLAIAIGNPFGLEGTMTLGIVSAVGRVIRPGARPFSIPNMIQTDAPINPGNSGGPLLDSEGRVIGVNTMIFSQSGTSSGVGFAVPVNTVKRVVPELIARGRYDHPWLGISGFSVTPLAAKELGLPAERGALILEVDPRGPAAQAGLRGGTQPANYEGETIALGGDLIVAIDGQPVRSMEDLIAYLEEKRKPGDEVVLAILRDGKTQEVRVRLASRPSGA